MEEVKKYSKYKFILFIVIFILSMFLSGFFTAKYAYAAGMYEDNQYLTLQQWQNAENIPSQYIPSDLYDNNNVMIEVERGEDYNWYCIYITDYDTFIPFAKDEWNGVTFKYGYAVNKDYNLGLYELIIQYTDDTKQIIDHVNTATYFKQSKDIVGNYKFIANPLFWEYTGGGYTEKYKEENKIIYSSCDIMDFDGVGFFFQRKVPTPKIIEGVIVDLDLSQVQVQLLYLVPVMMILMVGFLGLRKALRALLAILRQA